MTKAMKTTLSVSFVLAAVAMTLFICWYIQGRTAMDDAAARVKQNEDMIFVRDKWSTPFFVKRDIYGDLFGENGDKTLSFLPPVTIDEKAALQMAMDFFERYNLNEGYPIQQVQAPTFVLEYNGGKYYEVDIEIDKPRPKYIINKDVLRKNVYRFFVNDNGVLYVYLQ